MEGASTTSTQISRDSIEQIIDNLKRQHHRDTTKRNYYTVWRIFNKFLIKLDKKPISWGDRLTLFVGHLIDNHKQSSTVKSYISAVKSVLLENGLELNEDQFLLNSLTRACQLVNDQIKCRLPIQRPMLEVILRQISKHFDRIGQPYLKLLYRTIFSTMYFGLFRIGELTSGDHPVLARDVRIAKNKKKFLFILRTSKTHGKGTKPQQIKITSKIKKPSHKHNLVSIKRTDSRKAQDDLPCPYKLLNQYRKVRGTCSSFTEPFFVFSDKSPVKPANVRNCLKLILTQCKFEHPQAFTVHGIRAGRAVDLLELGLTINQIKRIGRWKSNAVFRYLR